MTTYAWFAAGAAVALLGALSLSQAQAGSLQGSVAKIPSTTGPVVLVDGDWDDDDWEYRRYRRYYRGSYVRAPFTRVETGYRGRVAVDAPFASVRTGPRGTWVRAPFVNIFVPR